MNNTRKKELMKIGNFEQLTPPYREYTFFEESDAFKFKPDANDFDMVNAWWLIEAATLAYDKNSNVMDVFGKAGFDRIEFITGPKTDTECYVASTDRFAIVAFRGTESWPREGKISLKHILTDIKTDANFRLVDAGEGRKVHQGFKKALDEVWERLEAYLDNIHAKDLKVWVTGHSLGAALATLMADRYDEKVQGLYTFGSPRVGDASFKENFSVKTFRFVNNNDIVSRVPPDGSYKHVGSLKYIDSRGIVHDNIPETKREKRGRSSSDEFRDVYDYVDTLWRRLFEAVIPDPIMDHVPVHYVVHIWNNIQ